MNVPVFILARDRMSVRHVVEWFEKAEGVERIVVCDHGTTYPPCIAYYESIQSTHQILTAQVERPYDCFIPGLRALMNNQGRFMVVDCDMLFDGCPTDLIPHCLEALDKHDDVLKCGPGIRVDDLPPCHPCLKHVMETELQWWVKPLSVEPFWFEANLDTTCALHDTERSISRKFGRFLRSDFPYVIRHLTWYIDPSNPPEDERYYYEHAERRGWHTHMLEQHEVLPQWDVPWWMGLRDLKRYAHLIEITSKHYGYEWNHEGIRNAKWVVE